MDEKMLAMFKEKEQQNRFTAYNHIEIVLHEHDQAILRLKISPDIKKLLWNGSRRRHLRHGG